jgi:hypothetical protein
LPLAIFARPFRPEYERSAVDFSGDWRAERRIESLCGQNAGSDIDSDAESESDGDADTIAMPSEYRHPAI